MQISVHQAQEFANHWLPAWSGNNPELLASFYSDDAFYSDPAIPNGIKGKNQLLSYFNTLLHYNPNWVWKQKEAIPMENGFVNKWIANIPIGKKTLIIEGICLVMLNTDNKIYRNEVYFDRSILLQEINIHKQKNPS